MFTPEPALTRAWYDWRMAWKRRRLRLRAIGKRRDLAPLAVRLPAAAAGDVTLFCVIRNEAERIDWFLHHYRQLGVRHFCFIDNASTDGTRETLLAQPDASVWGTDASYRAAHFGLDWLNWLMLRYGRGRWCLMVDADELLIYPNWQTRPLPALTAWLEREGQRSFAAMMIELYPKGPLDAFSYTPGSDPTDLLRWFDAGNYTITRKPLLDCLLLQGGVRARHFFHAAPGRAPTLTKIPLVRWDLHCLWMNSAHSLLPPRLNHVYRDDGGEGISGALLHTKFLPTVVEKARIEKARGQHFGNAQVFDDYYDALMRSPDLWCAGSTRYEGWQQLETLGLMSRGGWA